MSERSLSPWSGRGGLDLASPFASLRKQMDDLFEGFFGASPLAALRRWDLGDGGGFTPRVNVVENEKEVRITAELPGVDEKDVSVTVSEDSLTLRGEKKEETKSESESFYRVERSFGSFERTLPLPAEVVTDKAEATFKNGVLTVVLPRAQTAKERKKIEIKTK
jgi:HSP20 family protein